MRKPRRAEVVGRRHVQTQDRCQPGGDRDGGWVRGLPVGLRPFKSTADK
jgi:hypothetical protein